ncbi:MAG: transcriptional regulator, LuxR family [Actinoallomurus sp.]|nr:transcriptional regulator, LuxR family [Actinoallomurus sp.]
MSMAIGDADTLLERDGELEVLHALLRRASRGEGGVAVIAGPPGAGKTALVHAVRGFGRRRGLRDLYARGREFERDIGFGVAAGLLGPPVLAMPAEDRRGLLSGVAGLPAALLDVLNPASRAGQARPAAGPAPASEQVVLGLYWLAATLCCPDDESGESIPLLLTVDDAHWSDVGSLQFLCHLADHVDELPLAVVVGARAGGHDARQPWLDRLAAHPHSVAVTPRPLSDDAVALLVGRSLPGARPAFSQACAQVSGGNPFLLVELLRSLQADGIRPTEKAAGGIAEIVPDAVLRSVLARLAQLPAQARQLAGAVAVLGDDVPLARAAALAGIDVVAAEQAADTLATAHLLRPGAPLAFTHPLIGGAIHSDLPRFARARAHRRAADLLTAEGEPPDGVAGHLLLTEPTGDQRTVAMLEAAATRASLRGDGVAAARLLRRALAEPPPRPYRAVLLTELAVVQLRTGDPAAARTCREALGLAAEPAARSRVHDVLAQILVARGENEEAAAQSAKALNLLSPGSPAWQDVLARHLTAVVFQPRQMSQARSWLAPLVAEARAGRHPTHAGLRTHLALHLALSGTARPREVAEHAVALGGDPPVVAESNGTLAGLLIHALVLVDELETAEKIADDALASAQGLGSVIAYANASYHRALCRYVRGALAEAWADLEQVRIVGAMGGSGAAGWIGALLVDLAVDTGDLEAARAGLRFAQRAPKDSMEHALCLAASARLLLLDGEPDAAAAAALQAGRFLMDGFGIDHPGLVAWRPLAALAAHAAGRFDEARALSAEGVSRAEAIGVARPLGVALHAAGLVAPAQSSVALLMRAVEVLEGSPGALEHARALVSLGVALRRGNRQDEARRALRRGLSLADAMGCGPLAVRARAELLASGARPRRAAVTGRAALTPTERRVADLAAAGRTNRQIAQALFVTAKTIETHMTHVYRKLQVPDRSRLAAALEAPLT